MSPSRRSALVILGFAILGAGACEDANRGGGGETHWLGACDSPDDCASGTCLCGVCTKACDGDGACGEVSHGAECFDTRSPGVSAHCPAASANPKGICLSTCARDENCAPGSQCVAGACIGSSRLQIVEAGPGDAAMDPARPPSPAAADGGMKRPIIDAGPPLPSATDFADVEVPVSFHDPVLLPPPSGIIRGDASPFAGSWIELGSGDAPCTLMNRLSGFSTTTCAHLEIHQKPDGAFVGTIQYDQDETVVGVAGPFAPVADPDVGYPTELDPTNYYQLFEVAPFLRYPLLDANVEGNTLTFWFSPLDLWSGWCALQHSYHWIFEDHEGYRCVAQSADQSNTDLGKLALCLSYADGPVCKDTYGISYACACLSPDGEFLGKQLPLCGQFACECSPDECHAALRTHALTGRLTLDGGRLHGSINLSAYSEYSLTLARVVP